jgi:hypothetical protein
MPDKALDDLAAEIKSRGLIEAITLCEQQILDGRNREIACERAGVEPRYVEYQGDDPIGFVVSKNKYRRHMTPADLAFVAVELETLTHGEARASRGACSPAKTRDQIGAELGIGHSVIDSAKALLERGEPNVIAMVKRHEVGVTNAAAFVRHTSREEQRAADAPTIKQRGNALRCVFKNGLAERKPRKPKPPPMGQILLRRAERMAMPPLTREQLGQPPKELENVQHPDYPPGHTYAHVWREKEGRINLWPLEQKRQIELSQRFTKAIGQLAKFAIEEWPAPADLDKLDAKQRESAVFHLKKQIARLEPWLDWFKAEKAALSTVSARSTFGPAGESGKDGRREL